MTRKLFSGNACTIAVNNIPIVYYTYLVPARNTQSNKNKMEMSFLFLLPFYIKSFRYGQERYISQFPRKFRTDNCNTKYHFQTYSVPLIVVIIFREHCARNAICSSANDVIAHPVHCIRYYETLKMCPFCNIIQHFEQGSVITMVPINANNSWLLLSC